VQRGDTAGDGPVAFATGALAGDVYGSPLITAATDPYVDCPYNADIPVCSHSRPNRALPKLSISTASILSASAWALMGNKVSSMAGVRTGNYPYGDVTRNQSAHKVTTYLSVLGHGSL